MTRHSWLALSRWAQIPLMAATIFLAGGAVAHAVSDKPWAIDQILGQPSAPITIIEYASLTCPHCAVFEHDVIPKLKTEWIDTGKARLIFRDFPLDAGAQAAAMIAHCSKTRYFAFLDLFFASHSEWARADSPLAALKKVALLGGMTSDDVDACIADDSLLDQINQRRADAETLYGIQSTPTFVINGKVFVGEKSYDEFAKLLRDVKH